MKEYEQADNSQEAPDPFDVAFMIKCLPFDMGMHWPVQVLFAIRTLGLASTAAVVKQIGHQLNQLLPDKPDRIEKLLCELTGLGAVIDHPLPSNSNVYYSPRWSITPLGREYLSTGLEAMKIEKEESLQNLMQYTAFFNRGKEHDGK